MELRFENCCTLTKDALLAMNRKNRNPVFTAAVFVLCAAYLVNGVRAAMAGYPTGLIAPIACAVVLGVFAYFLPNLQAWFEYRKNLAAFGRDARCITKFYDDRFVVENLTTGKEASIPYARIRKVAEDERYVFLLLDKQIHQHQHLAAQRQSRSFRIPGYYQGAGQSQTQSILQFR